ncbi:MAG: T9SS type A sorting domain-containing protein [Chitinophagales bacterium]
MISHLSMRPLLSFISLCILHCGIFAQADALGEFIGVAELPADNASICPIPIVNLDLGGIQEGDVIPDFQLFSLEGIALKASDILASGKPALFISCSYTCPVFRNKIANINYLNSLYGDLLHIYLIYTLEAHPIVDISPYYGYVNTGEVNYAEGILYTQPTTYLERKHIAEDMLENETIDVPLVIDGPCNEWWSVFGTNPNCAFLVDTNGVIYDAQEWYNRFPDDIFESVEKLLGIENGVSSAMNGTVLYPEVSADCISAEAGTTIYAGNLIVNDDLQDAFIEIDITDKVIPDGWNYSICTDICYPPGVDTANMVVQSGNSVSIGIYFYTSAGTQENGAITLELTNKNVPGNSAMLKVEACTEIKDHSTIELYPNPVSEMLNINAFDSTGIISLQILNMQGQLMYSANTDLLSFQLPVVNFPNGIYLVELVFQDRRETMQFIVLHE